MEPITCAAALPCATPVVPGLPVHRGQGGFTLIEALVALGLAVTLAMFVLQSLAPWLDFRQRLENERRMQSMASAITAVYKNGLAVVDASADAEFTVQDGTAAAIAYQTEPAVAGGQCRGMLATGVGSSLHLVPRAAGVGLAEFELDGYNKSWCFYASERLSVTRNGLPLHYHVFAVVSTGRNGKIDTGTAFNTTLGTLDMAGDDRGVIVDGRFLQEAAFDEAKAKLGKVVRAYETYFTSRYLANPARDITVDYFTNTSDSSGVVPGTGGTFASGSVTLTALGLSPEDYSTSYGEIQVGNHDECVDSPTAAHPQICVQSPVTGNRLPWTAVLRVEMPSGEFLSAVALGGY